MASRNELWKPVPGWRRTRNTVRLDLVYIGGALAKVLWKDARADKMCVEFLASGEQRKVSIKTHKEVP